MLTQNNQVNLSKERWQKVAVVALVLITVVLVFACYQFNNKINKLENDLAKLQKAEPNQTPLPNPNPLEEVQGEVPNFCKELEKQLEQVKKTTDWKFDNNDCLRGLENNLEGLQEVNLQNHLDQVTTHIFESAIKQFEKEYKNIPNLSTSSANSARTTLKGIIVLVEKFQNCCKFRDNVKKDLEDKAAVDGTTGKYVLTGQPAYDYKELQEGRGYLRAFANILDLYLNTKTKINQLTFSSKVSELEKKHLRNLNINIDTTVKSLFTYANEIKTKKLPAIFKNKIH
ncbi:hypothetical protein HPP_4140 [Hydrangea phyllody phytoplasma]|uniref:Uncharacterized protein n=2 Tax=16SrI (Aster yellows group) TaxID=3042590 RepID=A0ABQ5PSY5_9MOLU|nr:hypothetical protein [Hydrangea phyllody phytoplasma]GFZ75456.1 hypothetical protein HPP_4140 [Hydrangea phyllody phytoplasma]GLH61469.1 hypothetical protein RHYP_4150 [Rhus yellows phytoplasma]GLH61781.1 hypothetical protein HP2P_1880 [Hydrangea phyllody phytoplasma]